MRFIRLTAGDWQDLAPALSPDGKMLAFASNRGGYWDLYALSLADGQTLQLTDTPEYEGNPSWSPDNRWLAYEAYVPDETGGNLEIFVRTIGRLTRCCATRPMTCCRLRSSLVAEWPDDRFCVHPQGRERYLDCQSGSIYQYVSRYQPGFGAG